MPPPHPSHRLSAFPTSWTVAGRPFASCLTQRTRTGEYPTFVVNAAELKAEAELLAAFAGVKRDVSAA